MLPPFLRNPISPQQAKDIVRNRLHNRESDFLYLLKTCVFGHAKSPYLKLLEIAGCKYGDVQNLVEKEGVEGALLELLRGGDYLTSKEFHGSAKIIRGSSSFSLKPDQLKNPLANNHVPVKSSGSRSGGTSVEMDLAFLRDCAVDTVLYLDARKSLSSEKANWEVPGGAALLRILTLSCSGTPPARWFSQLDTHARKLGKRYQASAWILKLGGILAQTTLPQPQYVSLEDPLPIVRWMEDCLKGGRTPHLFTFASSAVRLSRCALEAGVDLRGAQLTMSGEPTTEARLNFVRRSHVDGVPAIGSAECGWIGYGCLAPHEPDDMHLLTDLHAFIQPGNRNSNGILKNSVNIDSMENPCDLKPGSLLLTTLRLTAPLIMINVSLGDEAQKEKRSCGCPLEGQGLDTHVQYVRSFEKLTSGGMAFLDTDVIHILEEELPKRFGGAPMDYQLIEDERLDGEPNLRIVIHPRIGPLDSGQVKNVFLDAIASGSGAKQVTSLVWGVGERLSVERSEPRLTSTGKIQHMHIQRNK